MTYGLPYMGSKNVIAKELINFIENFAGGDRFVDLFGVGGAMTHCALTFGNFSEALYNDKNPLIYSLLTKAVDGFYNPQKFIPQFCTRENFLKNKNRDGFIKYTTSFGYKGYDYLYSKDREEHKHSAHNYIVNDIINNDLKSTFGNNIPTLCSTNWMKRCAEWEKAKSFLMKIYRKNILIIAILIALSELHAWKN